MSYYNTNNMNSHNIGVPGSGFASRGKGGNIKRLSFAAVETNNGQDNGAPTPRTSRSHMLAGLRTAPKSANTQNFPPSAPPSQLHHRGLDSSIYSDNRNRENQRMSYGGPKTSIGSSFQSQNYNQGYNKNQMYSVPEQILAPPEIHVDEHGQEQMDPNLYAQLVATNLYLAEQQKVLQQQLINVQAAAQQFQGMNMNSMNRMQQQNFATPPITPGGVSMYQQNKQIHQNMQPIVTPVPGVQAGLYSVYNPLTGQQSYFIDQNAAQNLQQQQYLDQQAEMFMEANSPPQQPGTPRFQVSPPPSEISTSNGRSISPPKKSTSPPVEHNPLPPPSATAFRFNRDNRHKKASSLANVITNGLPAETENGLRSALPKTAGIPATLMTGTFGPGGSRAGEHPTRQPRNPPNIEELRAKPTSKHEGSKNFATRQRRSAVHNLVRAGLERRRAPGSGSTGSISPISETGEFQFVQTSSGENSDTDSGRSGRLSGKNSLGSLRTSIHGAIGSERPSSRQNSRQEVDTRPTTASTSASTSDCEKEMQPVISSFAAAMKLGGRKEEVKAEGRRAPMMVLSSAEKRKSTMF